MPLKNVKIGKNVIIVDESLVNIYDCTIGNHTKIGPFVEIQKNVQIGSKCKISSHTFICEGVEIKDNVFIGSNTSLIAPVVIESKSRIGAGSVITKNIPKNSLAIERSALKILRNKRSK